MAVIAEAAMQALGATAMKRYVARCCVAACVMLCSAERTLGQTYNGLVIFGDSLSDTGNYATVYRERAFPPPYDGGRLNIFRHSQKNGSHV